MNPTITLVLAISMWYISSVCVNIAWKKTYPHHKDILVLTTLQFGVSAVVSIVLGLLGYGKSVESSIWYRKMLPMGTTFALGQLCTNISLSMVSVGLTHVVKTAEPVIAVAAGTLILGESINFKSIVYIAFLIMGVCLTVVHDAQVDWTGIAFAGLSNIFLQGRNILIKKNQKETEMKEEAFKGLPLFCHTINSGMNLFLVMISVYIFAAPDTFSIFVGAIKDPSTYLVGLCFSSQHIFSYYVLANITITSHALFNSVKRALIIVISCVVLHTQLYRIQVVGIAMACYFFYLYLTEKKKVPPSDSLSDSESASNTLGRTYSQTIKGPVLTILSFPALCGVIYAFAFASGILM